MFVALGECLTEKSGRINLGLEGVLVLSAMTGFGGSYLTGSILTETIFSWPGIGKWMIDAIARRDYPVVQAGIVISALVFMGVNLCVEVLYGLINPRMRAPSPVRANE